MRPRKLALLVFASLVYAGSSSVPVHAKDVAITKNNQGTVIAWTARFDEVQNGNTVDLTFDAASGTITKKATFNNLTPISILFFEDVAATEDSENTEGIRLFMKGELENKTPFDWKGFDEQLVEMTPVCDGGQDQKSAACKVTTKGRVPATRTIGTPEHPQFPHFHSVAATKLAPFTDATPGGFNRKSFINATGGPVKINAIWKPEQIVVHNVEVQGFRRQFVLTEVPLPVPEPATWLTTMAGLAALAGYIRRRRRA